MYSMEDNRNFLESHKIYVKTTILESIVELLHDKYFVTHHLKEIVKNNDFVHKTVDEKFNWEHDKLSLDLNDKTTESGYADYSQKSTISNWEERNEESLQIKKDLRELIALVNNSRYEISKRVFGS